MRVGRISFLFFILAVLAACGGDRLPPNERLQQIFSEGRTAVWVSGHGAVSQILADETGADPHQRFIVRIDDNLAVMIRHSLARSERVPAERGDVIAFQGRYEWNAGGGVVSQTHRDDSQPGGGGWIQLQGRRYD